MKFLSGFFTATANCFKGFGILFEKGLWPFLLYTIIIWALTFVLTLLGVAAFSDWMASLFTDYIKTVPTEGHWLSWAKPYMEGAYIGVIIAFVFKVALWFISGTFSKYMVLIILSPLFALLSEKTEEKLTGKSFPFSFDQLMKDIGRGVLISLRNMFFEYLFVIAVFVLTIIFPVSAFITTPLLLFVSWYFTGFTMLDYSSERHRFGIGQSVRFVKSNKGYACGIGFVYWLLTFFSFFPLSILAIIFAPAVVVIGATVTFMQINNPEETRS
jgi:CysZ protein